MSIKVYSGNKNLKYKYSKGGVYRLQLTNNVSSAVFSGEELNGIRGQLVRVQNLDRKFIALGDYSFSNCTALSGITFNDTLQTVGNGCFKNCVNLCEAQLSPSIRKIGEQAFAGDRNLTCMSFKHFEDDQQDSHTSYALTSVGNSMLDGAARCGGIVLPNSVNGVSMLGNSFLSGSSVTNITFLGMTQAEAAKSAASGCFGIGHDCCVYTSDGKMALFSAGSNSFTDDPSYTVYRGMKVSVGKKDRMTLGKKIYGFTEELFKWCIIPSTQDSTKFAQRDCPTITIFCDLVTSVKSQAFADNVLRQQALYTWMKENLKCYVFLMNRNGKIQASESPSDLSYYRSFFGAQGASQDFVSVSFYYKGKFSCVTLSELTLTEFKKTLLDGCSRTGFDGFNSDGYDKIGDEPDAETPPSKAVDQTSIAAFHSGGFDWYANGNAVTPTNWNIASQPMDFDLIATPETTFVLVGFYTGSNFWNLAPTLADYKSMWEPFTDHFTSIAQTSGSDSSVQGKYKTAFLNGMKYRYFIFFECSHGNVKSLSIGITYDEIWNAFSHASQHQKVFGVFESCYGGSLLQSTKDGEQTIGILEYLKQKFDRRTQLANALFGASLAARTVPPKMILYSACDDAHSCYYAGDGHNYFSMALKSECDKNKNQRFHEYFEKAKVSGKHSDAIPQYSIYPDETSGFNKNKIFI